MGNHTLPPHSFPVASPSPAPIIVGVADLQASNLPDVVIATFALGSCLGITGYDPSCKVGGLLHAMLPDASQHNQATPAAAMFLDTGLAALLESLLQLGANPDRCEFKVFGGSRMQQAVDYFNIGLRNVETMQSLAAQHKLRVKAWDVGGQVNRTIKLSLHTGGVLLRLPGRPEVVV